MILYNTPEDILSIEIFWALNFPQKIETKTNKKTGWTCVRLDHSLPMVGNDLKKYLKGKLRNENLKLNNKDQQLITGKV